MNLKPVICRGRNIFKIAKIVHNKVHQLNWSKGITSLSLDHYLVKVWNLSFLQKQIYNKICKIWPIYGSNMACIWSKWLIIIAKYFMNLDNHSVKKLVICYKLKQRYRGYSEVMALMWSKHSPNGWTLKAKSFVDTA